MVFRLALASVALASLAATAHAQAPGEVAPQAPADPSAPVVPARESVMANRWAVGLGIGHLSVAPDSMPDAKSEFDVAELQVRFRATLHLELALSMSGGNEVLPGGEEGSRVVNVGYLGARYRFAAEQQWNWWLMMGLGGMSVTQQDATDQQRKDAQRPVGVAGIGIERRFQHFALSAELQYIGVGKKDMADTRPTKTPVPDGGAPPPPLPPVSTDVQEHQSGGRFTIGASYYF